jgi:hypothetical protein
VLLGGRSCFLQTKLGRRHKNQTSNKYHDKTKDYRCGWQEEKGTPFILRDRFSVEIMSLVKLIATALFLFIHRFHLQILNQTTLRIGKKHSSTTTIAIKRRRSPHIQCRQSQQSTITSEPIFSRRRLRTKKKPESIIGTSIIQTSQRG